MHFGWFWCLWLKFWFTLVKQMKMVWLRLMAMIMIYFVVYFVVLLYNTRSYNKRQCFSVIFSLSFSQSLWALLSFNLLFSAQTHSIIQVSSETIQCWIYLWECITNRFSHIIHVMTPFLANILCSILIFLHLLCASIGFNNNFLRTLFLSIQNHTHYTYRCSSFSHHICYSVLPLYTDKTIYSKKENMKRFVRRN